MLYILFCANLQDVTAGTNVGLLSYADDTKIYRHISNEGDMEELQVVIDRLMAWLEMNNLLLNKSKTYQMTFTRAREKKVNSVYFIERHRIEEKFEMKDLGIIFDGKLNFNSHLNFTSQRARIMHGVAYRFANEIHSQKIVLPIINTYVIPIMEYGSIIWRREIAEQNKKMEMSLRFGTRLFLGLPFSTMDPRYKSYQERLNECKLITMEQRSNIAAILFVMKCIQGQISSTISDEINSRKITESRTRNPRIFKTDDLYYGGPLHRILSIANRHRNDFNFDESIPTTKKKMKAMYLGMTT